MKKFVKSSTFRFIIMAGLLLLASCMIYGMTFFSAIPHVMKFFRQNPFWLLINVIYVFSGMIILKAIFGNCWKTILVTSLITFVWSIANYYTVTYHGSPLFLSEYANLMTALDVAGSYSFGIDGDVVKLICIILALQGVAFLVKMMEQKGPGTVAGSPKRRVCGLVIGMTGLGMASFLVLGPLKLKPETTMGWSWKAGVEKYGFLVCCLEDAHNGMANPYKMPEGYSLEALSNVEGGKEATATEYPDLIVILNETFCDLEAFYEINPDVSPLEKYYAIDDAAFGFAHSGGGTNDSEYELLLSNSLYLLNKTSPFNFAKLKDHFSIVTYVEELGYSTIGMHCGQKENYHRNRAYKDLGFDRIFLGRDDFKYQKGNFNRKWLDSENYRDMMDHLEENASDPQFVFLLTYQNHGGYDKNDDSLDTVHSGVDYGKTTSRLNEYMSSLKLSSDAFFELTESLKGKRPTVVLMVGDHGPALGDTLARKSTENGYNEELIRSLVPYVIWTNFKEVPDQYSKIASMEDLIPMMLDVAGLPLSTYYNVILELRKNVPLRNGNGAYVDANGREGQYSAESEYYDLMNKYFYLEYNSFDLEKMKKELFLP
ncbi:MAG: sulfatase-like hydrolase/transferase [Lachnospiraceae bacterium]|nr:sulfatase-like hydrolase/transferase [Lachnospiraceae bacterium]